MRAEGTACTAWEKAGPAGQRVKDLAPDGSSGG